ncbi:MAG TPA: PAS domain-containing protein [Longimicrobiaceae bacterium]|nr:PAS domain-containing protein [Longimicrobiaceae bacterium]
MFATLPSSVVLEAIQDGVYTLDAGWRVTYWNAAAERLLGISREEALGRRLEEVAPHSDRAEVRESLRRAMEEREPSQFRERLTAGDRPRYFAVHAAPMEGEGIIVHFRDATQEIGVQEQYARLLESIRDGFVAVDPEWRIVYVNAAAESLLSLPRKRVVGADLWTLLPTAPAEIGETLRATMQDGSLRHLSAVRPEGRVFRDRFFDIWVYPLPLGGVSILFEDVSEQIRRERDLARLAAEAEEANRAKSRFFTAVSHELRTPLNAIVGYTHLLSTETYGVVPPAAQRAAERAGVCAEHLARLVDDVLLVTTAEIGRLPVSPTPLALEPFLRSALEPLRQQAEAKQLHFGLRVAEEAAVLETDPERLRQLLVALVGNAVKFTSRGEVVVEARAVAGPGGEEVEIAVMDTGPGIPPENREKIFEAFEQLGNPSRTDSMRRGTGFGLTVARQIALLLRGWITAEGRDGEGSVFRVRLPRSYDAHLPEKSLYRR